MKYSKTDEGLPLRYNNLKAGDAFVFDLESSRMIVCVKTENNNFVRLDDGTEHICMDPRSKVLKFDGTAEFKGEWVRTRE